MVLKLTCWSSCWISPQEGWLRLCTNSKWSWMCLKLWHKWYRNLYKILDEYCPDSQSRTMFLSPLCKCLPFECAGHWKKVSNKREPFGSRRKTASLTLAIYPIKDKDGKSSKNEGKLRESHLWKGAELEIVTAAMHVRISANSINITAAKDLLLYHRLLASQAHSDPVQNVHRTWCKMASMITRIS